MAIISTSCTKFFNNQLYTVYVFYTVHRIWVFTTVSRIPSVSYSLNFIYDRAWNHGKHKKPSTNNQKFNEKVMFIPDCADQCYFTLLEGHYIRVTTFRVLNLRRYRVAGTHNCKTYKKLGNPYKLVLQNKDYILLFLQCSVIQDMNFI